MNTPITIQTLETAHNGYANWPVFILRDARNIALAEIGHIDRASAAHSPALAKLFAAAPIMLSALKTALEVIGVETTKENDAYKLINDAIAAATPPPQFAILQRVRITQDVHWTDDHDVERITPAPCDGIVTAIDSRDSGLTLYEILIDDGQGYFMHEPTADGPVVIPL